VVSTIVDQDDIFWKMVNGFVVMAMYNRYVLALLFCSSPSPPPFFFPHIFCDVITPFIGFGFLLVDIMDMSVRHRFYCAEKWRERERERERRKKEEEKEGGK